MELVLKYTGTQQTGIPGLAFDWFHVRIVPTSRSELSARFEAPSECIERHLSATIRTRGKQGRGSEKVEIPSFSARAHSEHLTLNQRVLGSSPRGGTALSRFATTTYHAAESLANGLDGVLHAPTSAFECNELHLFGQASDKRPGRRREQGTNKCAEMIAGANRPDLKDGIGNPSGGEYRHWIGTRSWHQRWERCSEATT